MDEIEANDLLRTEGKGGKVLMTSAVWNLDPQLRGRALYRMALAQKFTQDDHSEGVFLFAGYVFVWTIGMFAGERSITLGIGEDFLR
jgi:hypothetical protein